MRAGATPRSLRKEIAMTVRKAAAAASCVMAMALTGCGAAAQPGAPAASSASCGPLTEMATVTLGVNPGTQDLVTSALKDQGLDKKYNLNVEIKSFLNPPASATAMTQKTVDIGFGGITTMAVARSRGSDVFFFGALATPANGIFVPKDSALNSLGDLKGHKLGSFSGTNSATFAILSALAAKSFNIPDLKKSAQVIVAPDAALSGLLDKGEIDAILAGSTASVAAELSGKYKQIADLSGGYQKAAGTKPVYLGPVSTDSYAADHCGQLKAFSNAMRDAVKYVQSDDKAWTDYAAKIKMTDPKAPKALQDLLGSNFVTEWDAKQIEGMNALLDSLIPILGEKDFVATVPKGLFRLDFQATS